jgi:hypothetical protein
MRVYSRAQTSVPETCLLGTRHPALRRQEPGQGRDGERENLIVDVKGEGESGDPASREYQCHRSGADALVVAVKSL